MHDESFYEVDQEARRNEKEALTECGNILIEIGVRQTPTACLGIRYSERE